MKNQTELPIGYVPLQTIDLVKDKPKALLVNGLALLIAAVMVLLANPLKPLRQLFGLYDGSEVYIFRLYALFLGLVAYILLHEVVHGIFMRCLGGLRPRFGFKGVYAYAGSKAYFNKKSYIVIALAPIVLLGLVLLVLNLLAPPVWFWVVYLIQITNISGAAGDLYVVWRFSKLPPDILIQDTGVAMTVFCKEEK